MYFRSVKGFLCTSSLINVKSQVYIRPQLYRNKRFGFNLMTHFQEPNAWAQYGLCGNVLLNKKGKHAF